MLSMRGFLQTRPFWLYKAAGVFLVLLVVLVWVIGEFEQDDVVTYPFLIGYFPLINYPLIVCALVILVRLALAVIRRLQLLLSQQSGNRLWLHFVSAGLVFPLWIAVAAVIGPQVPEYRQVANIQVEGKNFNLVSRNNAFASFGMQTFTPHTLYECDRISIVCHELYTDFLKIDNGLCGTMDAPVYVCPTTIELAVLSDELVILIDDDIVYRHNLPETQLPH